MKKPMQVQIKFFGGCLNLLMALCFLFSEASFAEIQKTGEADIYEIDVETTEPLKFTITSQVETRNNCNSFRISADLLEMLIPADVRTSRKTFAIDGQVSRTESGCPNGPNRTIHLESKEFSINPDSGQVRATIFVPKYFQIKIK